MFASAPTLIPPAVFTVGMKVATPFKVIALAPAS